MVLLTADGCYRVATRLPQGRNRSACDLWANAGNLSFVFEARVRCFQRSGLDGQRLVPERAEVRSGRWKPSLLFVQLQMSGDVTEQGGCQCYGCGVQQGGCQCCGVWGSTRWVPVLRGVGFNKVGASVAVCGVHHCALTAFWLSWRQLGNKNTWEFYGIVFFFNSYFAKSSFFAEFRPWKKK